MWRLYLRMDGRKTGRLSKDMYDWASALGCRARLLCQLTAGATEAVNIKTNTAACPKGPLSAGQVFDFCPHIIAAGGSEGN